VAGKSDAITKSILAIAVFVGLASICSAAEPVRGRSRDLGIDFAAVGGAKWCAPSVVMRLDGPQPSIFNPDNSGFVLMIGRIKSIILDQCPSVELITFEGRSRDRPVFGLELSRLTKWRRLVRLEPVTRKPICDGTEPSGPECDKRVAAYATAKQMMRGPTFADTEIVRLLDTNSGEQLVWNDHRVVGKLQLSHRGELGGQLTDNTALADAIIAQTSAACVAAGGKAGVQSTSSEGGKVAHRAFNCEPAGGRPAQNVVLVTSENDWFYIFSLWSDDSDRTAAAKAARELVTAIAAVKRH
jgi:hypothetical protein